MSLSKVELEKFVTYLQKQTVEIFKRDGHINPMFFVLLPKKHLMMVPAPMDFNNDGMKVQTALIIRKIAAEYDAQAVALVTEAWTLQGQVSEEEAAKGVTIEEVAKEIAKKKVETHPDRKETLNIILSAPGHELFTMAEVIRIPPGDETAAGFLKDWQDVVDDPQVQGTFSHFFEPRTASEMEATVFGKIAALKKLPATEELQKQISELESLVSEESSLMFDADVKIFPVSELKKALGIESEIPKLGEKKSDPEWKN